MTDPEINKINPEALTVKSAFQLTPNMRRVTLYGAVIARFPENTEGAVIKLLFDLPGYDRPPKRTYTISQCRPFENEIDIDFMLHKSNDGSDNGIAVPWSLNTQTGESISFFGPGRTKYINPEAEHFLLAADMAGLPALASNLKRLPQNAHGKVFIEIISEADKQPLEKPDNIEIIWVVNNQPGSDESPLFHKIEQAGWFTGSVSAWVACEYKTMKKIRHYLKVEHAIPKPQLYVSSYWKKGNTEEQHKAIDDIDERD